MSKLDMELINKFREISKRLLLMQKEVINNTSINLLELNLLSALDINEKLNQTNLSFFCDIDKPSMSRHINKMYEQGLVDRVIDKNDRRTTFITLSKNGKKLLNNLREKLLKISEKYFNNISDNDKEIFINLLNKTLYKGDSQC